MHKISGQNHTDHASERTAGSVPASAAGYAPARAFTHPIVSVEGVRERLGAYGCKPNKALGQNFLIDRNLLGELLGYMDGGNPAIPLPALEIGPGLGALTEGLLATAGRRVVAIEKDAVLARILRETLPGDRPTANQPTANQPTANQPMANQLTVIEGDALRVPLGQAQAALCYEPDAPFLVAGNLPYYITTPLCLRLLGSGLPILRMVLMVQQEAAARFLAQPGDRVYGPLSVLCARAFRVEEVMRLPPSAYYPQPEVRSSVLVLAGDARYIQPGLPAFLAGVFSMRRKTLLNNLQGMGYSREAATNLCEAAGVSPSTRAEALPPEALLALFVAVDG